MEKKEKAEEELYEDLAKDVLEKKKGYPGGKGPFYAETASTKRDEEWPLWIVRDKTCNSTGKFMCRSVAEKLASAMNKVDGL